MNERIQELIEQSGIERRPNIAKTGWDFCLLDSDIEKFAELIVQECFDCIDIMEKIAHSTNASIPKDYDKHTYFETLDTMRGLLKTHFGVE